MKFPSSTRDFFSVSFLYPFTSSLIDGTIYVIVIAKIENAFGFEMSLLMKSKTSLIFKTKGEVPTDRTLLGWEFTLVPSFICKLWAHI